MQNLFRASSLCSKVGTCITRGAKFKRPTSPTPPSWYQKHALMYGEYEEGKPATSLPMAHQCNVHEKALYSIILNKKVKVKISTAALEMVDKMGGLDFYIMYTDIDKLGGEKSAAGVLKRMLEENLRKRNAKEGFTSTEYNDSGEKSVVYSVKVKQYTWRDMLEPSFWDKRI